MQELHKDHIRQLSYREVDKLLPGAREFFSEAYIPGGLNDEIFVKNWQGLIQVNAGIIWGAFSNQGLGGALAGILFNDLCNDDKTFTEQFFFVRPEFRKGRLGIKLIAEVESDLRKMGCQRIYMAQLMDSMPEKVAKLYQHRGYTPKELLWYKELIVEDGS